MPTSFSKVSGLTSQNVVTGSRAVGTVYQNTTGKPMFVGVSVLNSTITDLNFYTDSSNPPTTLTMLTVLANAAYEWWIGSWVLPGNYYKVTTSSGIPNLQKWTEWY